MSTTARANSALEEVYEVTLPPRQRADAVRAAKLLQNTKARRTLMLAAPNHQPVHVPAGAGPVMGLILQALLDGHSVAVLASPDAMVSTSTAAQLLGVSRPHVAKLVDTGILPASKPGTHRRLRIADVLAYHERVQERHSTLDAMMAETEALGLYEPPSKRRKPTKRTTGHATRGTR